MCSACKGGQSEEPSLNIMQEKLEGNVQYSTTCDRIRGKMLFGACGTKATDVVRHGQCAKKRKEKEM